MSVFFQGYEIFTTERTLSLEAWIPTFLPWVMKIILTLAFLGWFLYGRLRFGVWTWRIPKLRNINLWSGIAALEPDEDEKKLNWIQKHGRRLLNKL